MAKKNQRLFDTESLEKKDQPFDLTRDRVIVIVERNGRFDKQYTLPLSLLLGGGGGGDLTYLLSSPTTVTVGGLPQGSNIFGLGVDEILERILVPYQNPNFTSFSIQGQGTVLEVGDAFGGIKNFLWNTSNSGNVQTNSVSIIDVTSSTTLASGLSNDGVQAIDIGTFNITAPFTQSYRASAINTQGTPFNSNLFSIQFLYPYFYGVSNTIPSVSQSTINSGTKVVASSNSTINITFNATVQYLWFAIPTTSTAKTRWFVDTLNQGNIGTPTDLFGAPTVFNINSPTGLWSNVSYRMYISNFQTTTNGVMQLRNS